MTIRNLTLGQFADERDAGAFDAHHRDAEDDGLSPRDRAEMERYAADQCRRLSIAADLGEALGSIENSERFQLAVARRMVKVIEMNQDVNKAETDR